MKLALTFLSIVTLVSLPALADDAVTEAEMQARLCAGLETEVVLGGMGRADCVSDIHAIEIDWADKWHEGLGQVLSYATATGKRPGLVLDDARCLAYSLSAREVFATQRVDATVWECAQDAETLRDCLRREIDADP